MAKVIAVSTNKGGVLKTTTASNLGSVLAKNGKRVLIVDTDNQGNAALQFGVNPDHLELTIFDVLAKKAKASDAIVKLPYHGVLLDLLPANDDMTYLEHDIWFNHNPKDASPYLRLREALAPIINRYHYVIIDTGPSLGLATGNALAAADAVLIPFQPETNSMRSLLKIISAIGEYRALNPNLSIMGVMATLVDKRTTLHKDVIHECQQFCAKRGVRMMDTLIPKAIAFAASVHYHDRPAGLHEDTVYDELVKELGLLSEVKQYEQA